MILDRFGIDLFPPIFGAKHSPSPLDPWLTEGRILDPQRKFVKLTNVVRYPENENRFFENLQMSIVRDIIQLQESSIISKIQFHLRAKFSPK